MKIAFWSNVSDRCAVSENLAAISVASVIRYSYSVVMMENRLCNHNLGRAFMGNGCIAPLNEVGTNYYDGAGIESLLRKIYRQEKPVGDILKHMKEIIQKRLYYLPQSRVIHSDIFDYEFDHCLHPLLSMMEEFADICFIDTASQNNLTTKTILEESDLIVVNLCQKQNILEDFFLNYSSLVSKAVFIISNYELNSLLNSRRIATSFHIPWENIAVIPYNEMYEDAFLHGNVNEFIQANYKCTKGSNNFMFMQGVKKASYIIMKKVELPKKSKVAQACGN
ncbi:MAG: hypothetical protein WBI07_19185 [Mobilitalea sp.]